MKAKSIYNDTTNQSLQRTGAYAFFAMPLCYVGMFIIFGLLLNFPQSDVVSDKIAYIASQEVKVSLGYIFGYLVFACLLLVAVQATHSNLNSKPSALLNYASAFGYIWVVLMMCSGMLALIGVNTMVSLYVKESSHAETVFYIYATVVNGLGGGIEFVGALWVLLVSVYALKTSQLTKPINVLGVVIGGVGILTLNQAIPEFKDAFGLLQVIWFVMMGFALLKSNPTSEG